MTRITRSTGPERSDLEERKREWADDLETDVAAVEGTDTALDGTSQTFLIIRDGEQLSQLALHDGGEWIVGRGPTAQITPSDRRVSRHHVKLMFRAGALSVEDLGSRNGTFVNGCSLRAATVRIDTGDVVEVGGCQLVVATRVGRVSLQRPLTPEMSPDLVDVVVADPEMARVFASVRRVARMPMTVLILGETGTGKDVLAQRLHQWSQRADQPFVRINCAGIPESLLESELFGHERGAFTGADRRKPGYFEAAHGGTIFLDEIGELSASAQVKLLNVLENRTVTRLGGTTPLPVDVRVVCATHRDLHALVAAERFRADLFYRISTFIVRIPPLGQRPAEISLLANVFAQQVAAQIGVPPPTFAPDAFALLRRYTWPGNVRELRNAVERAFAMADGGTLRREHFAPEILASVAPATPSTPPMASVRQRLVDVERETIEAALVAEGGNQTRAAVRLGMPRRTLVHKLTQYRREGQRRKDGQGEE